MAYVGCVVRAASAVSVASVASLDYVASVASGSSADSVASVASGFVIVQAQVQPSWVVPDTLK